MKLAFFLAVYSEFLPARQKILQLQHFYPDVEITTVTDGTYDSDYESFCFDHGVHYQTGERIKLQKFGGLWTARMLELLLLTSADTFFKIDPADTAIHRAFQTLPSDDVDLFGDIRETTNHRLHIQGGCIGIRRQAARALLDSGRLGSPEFCVPWYSYPRFDPDASFRYFKDGESHLESRDWITVEDLIIYDLAIELGLRIEPFAEVYCHYNTLPEGIEGYAITHPCYGD